MKPTNVNAIIFLGGIVLISLGYGIYTSNIYGKEAFAPTAEQAAADTAKNNANVRKGIAAFSHIPIDDKKAILQGLQSGILLGIDFNILKLNS